MFSLNFSELKETREEGFTLIELLVVILIVGVLSAIAIPAFLNQRQSAVDSAVESDMKNAAIAVETFFLKNPNATVISVAEIQKLTSKSDGVLMRFSGTKDDFCIIGQNPGGYHYRGYGNNPLPGLRPYALYQSKGGGLSNKTTYHSSLSCDNNIVTWS